MKAIYFNLDWYLMCSILWYTLYLFYVCVCFLFMSLAALLCQTLLDLRWVTWQSLTFGPSEDSEALLPMAGAQNHIHVPWIWMYDKILCLLSGVDCALCKYIVYISVYICMVFSCVYIMYMRRRKKVCEIYACIICK